VHAPGVLAQVEDAVRDRLKDPESARFTDVRKFPNGNACGWVNAKNSFGGYVGRKPFAYVDRAVLLDSASFESLCELAANPQKVKERVEAQRKAAREAAAAVARREEAERRRAEAAAYERCDKHRAALLEEAKHLEVLHVPISGESLRGSVDVAAGNSLDITQCPARFRQELALEVETERNRLFELYCKERRAQRAREIAYGRGYQNFVVKACGPMLTKEIASQNPPDAPTVAHQERYGNRQLWDCRLWRDFAIVGDKYSKAMYSKEFAQSCTQLDGQLD
jgi:hypothetical protein